MSNYVPGQLGFDALLSEASKQNSQQRFERRTSHLPSAMPDALDYFRALIGRHHAAMIAGDAPLVFELRDEAKLLARKMIGGKLEIMASDDAPGCRLANLTKAPLGEVPLWGQEGEFRIAVRGMRVRIDQYGIFGIGSSIMYWPGFAAHCVDAHKPFF